MRSLSLHQISRSSTCPSHHDRLLRVADPIDAIPLRFSKIYRENVTARLDLPHHNRLFPAAAPTPRSGGGAGNFFSDAAAAAASSFGASPARAFHRKSSVPGGDRTCDQLILWHAQSDDRWFEPCDAYSSAPTCRRAACCPPHHRALPPRSPNKRRYLPHRPVRAARRRGEPSPSYERGQGARGRLLSRW